MVKDIVEWRMTTFPDEIYMERHKRLFVFRLGAAYLFCYVLFQYLKSIYYVLK